MKSHILATLKQPVVARLIRSTLSAVLRLMTRTGNRGAVAASRLAYSRIALIAASDGVVQADRGGYRLELDLADNVQRTVYYTGTYEPEFLGFLRHQLCPGDVYLDVGGHVGIDALVAARRLREFGHGAVYAFEPAPDSAAKLRSQAGDNGVGSIVHVQEVALGARAGTLELRASAKRLNDSGLRSRYEEGPIICSAPMMTLDEWVVEHAVERVDLVKIDVEGGELDVLRGMGRVLRTKRPRIVVVELTPWRLRQAGTDVASIAQVLAVAGYQRSGEVFLENVVFRPVTAGGVG